MKRYLLYILTICLFLSCAEEYREESGFYPTLLSRHLSVTPTTMSFLANASLEKTLNISSAQTAWKIDNTLEWISLSSTSGSVSSMIDVNLTENTSGDKIRTGIFYLKSDVDDWKYEMPISVTQAGAEPTIELSKSSLDLKGSLNTESVSVISNCTYSILPCADWVSVTKNNDIILLTISPNETGTYRNTEVVVEHQGDRHITKSIVIRQAPANVNASTETLVFNNNASTIEVTLEAEASWSANTSNSWIELSELSGNSGTSKLLVSVSPNMSIRERTGYVVISIGSKQCIQIPLRQRGIYIESSLKKMSFTAAGETASFSVESNTSWVVTSIPSWLTITPSEGDGNKEVKVTAQNNPTTVSRSATIHVTQPGLAIDIPITISQAGKAFDINTTVLNFDAKQSSCTLDITAEDTWTANTLQKWIKVTPETAGGNSVLTVSVDENISTDERIGSITVSMADKTLTINVLQKGKYFTVNNDQLTYLSKGGSINISVSSNDNWTALVENTPSWLSLSKSNGNGTAEIIATAIDNPSVNKRSATIIFNTSHSQNVRIIVTQEARFMTVDNNKILFYAKGGDADPINVTTDGVYSVTCSDSWITAARNGNKVIITATENKTTEPRVSHVIFALTDLKEGSLSLQLNVTQMNKGGSFIKEDFNDDVDHDQNGITSGSLTISGFGNDMNWDNIITNNTSLTISGYKEDQNWDSNSRMIFRVTDNKPGKTVK